MTKQVKFAIMVCQVHLDFLNIDYSNIFFCHAFCHMAKFVYGNHGSCSNILEMTIIVNYIF
jgi:hypothetical protein